MICILWKREALQSHFCAVVSIVAFSLLLLICRGLSFDDSFHDLVPALVLFHLSMGVGLLLDWVGNVLFLNHFINESLHLLLVLRRSARKLR